MEFLVFAGLAGIVLAAVYWFMMKPVAEAEAESGLVECSDCEQLVPPTSTECEYCGKVGPYRWDYTPRQS